MSLQDRKVTALILAGEAKQSLLQDPAITNRAMIPLARKTVLQWVVDALLDSQVVGRITAVGNVQADGLSSVVLPPAEAGSFLGSLMAGLDAVEDAGRVLVLTSDIPLLTGEAVADFVSRALEVKADVVCPIIGRHLCERRYPDLRRTYVRVMEGEFTLGNMALVNVDFIRRNRTLIEKAYAARKSPLRMAGIVGLGFIFRLLLAQLGISAAFSISKIEQAASLVLGGRVAIVQSEFPEIGEDMDHPGDLEIMQRILT